MKRDPLGPSPRQTADLDVRQSFRAKQLGKIETALASSPRMAIIPPARQPLQKDPEPSLTLTDPLLASALDGQLNLFSFEHLGAQKRDFLVASIYPKVEPRSPGTTKSVSLATEPAKSTSKGARFQAYIDLWVKEFAPLNEKIINEAARLYFEKVGPAEPKASLTAAAIPINRLTKRQLKSYRTQITNRLLEGEGRISFDGLTARRTLDSISSALYGSDSHWFTDLITHEAYKQLEADLSYALLLPAGSAEEAEFIQTKLVTGFGKKLNNVIRGYLESYTEEQKLEFQDKFFTEIGKQIARSNPAVLNRYYPNLSDEVMSNIQTQVRDYYHSMVNKFLEEVDGYLLEGATEAEALERAQGIRPTNIREGDFKAKRRLRDYNNKYGESSKYNPRLDLMERDVANFTANTAMDEFAKAEEKRGKIIRRRWTAEFINTRPTHAAADGQIVGVNQNFTVGGFSAKHPHDIFLPPQERINCQCYVQIVEQVAHHDQRTFDIDAAPKL